MSFIATSQPVYNLEIFGEHVYRVGNAGVLCHNTDPVDPKACTFKLVYQAITDTGIRDKLGTLFRDGHLKLKDLKKMGYDQKEIEMIQRAAKDLRQNTPNSSKVIDSVVGSEKAIKNELKDGAENIEDVMVQYVDIKTRADEVRRMRRRHE